MPLLLDLFCGAGGAAMGYYQAGFTIVGIDIKPQKNYPFKFVRTNALGLSSTFLSKFDLIHASPPCQAYSRLANINGTLQLKFIDETRELLKSSGRPYIIENVTDAPLIDPIILCGSMFDGLRVYRHRKFETSFSLKVPKHLPHIRRLNKLGCWPKKDEFIHVVGNFSGVDLAREAMQIDWMLRDELTDAIPPAYTKYIGTEFLKSQ